MDTYLVPLVGHIELPRLQPEDIADAFDTIREWNDLLDQGQPVRKFQRHVGPVAMARILTPLQTALRDAMKSRLVEFNAAKLVSMKARRPTSRHYGPMSASGSSGSDTTRPSPPTRPLAAIGRSWSGAA